MKEFQLKHPQAKAHFNFACEMYDQFFRHSVKTGNEKLHPKKWAFMGTFIEECILLEFNAMRRKHGQSSAVDLNLPNGKTMQVKSSNSHRKQITCTYSGEESVDYILILDVNIERRKLYVLYHGPFKEFIKHVNSKTRILPKDNHMMPKKSGTP